MLFPKRTKYRKLQKPRDIRGKAQSGNKVSFGSYGLKAMTAGYITSRQIEAARKAMTRFVKRGGKIWIRIFPDHPFTLHPAESRMGSGKGSVEYYMATIKPGRVLFEMDGIPVEMAKEAMTLASSKLPCKTKFLVKE